MVCGDFFHLIRFEMILALVIKFEFVFSSAPCDIIMLFEQVKYWVVAMMG